MKKQIDAGLSTGMLEHCAVCGRDGETVLMAFSNGLVGRTCPYCRACRALKPYARRSEFEALSHDTVKAGKVNDERTCSHN